MAGPLRADWQTLQAHLKAWAKYQRDKPGTVLHSSVDQLSGIFASFINEEALIINRMRFGKKYALGIDESISGLRFFRGSPMWPVDRACYAKLLRKKLKGHNEFENVRLIVDDVAALVYIGEEYKFDKEKAERVYEDYLKQLRLRQHKEGGSGDDPSRDAGKTQGSNGDSDDQTQRRVDDKPADVPGNA